jgi:hypothetical protein
MKTRRRHLTETRRRHLMEAPTNRLPSAVIFDALGHQASHELEHAYTHHLELPTST